MGTTYQVLITFLYKVCYKALRKDDKSIGKILEKMKMQITR